VLACHVGRLLTVLSQAAVVCGPLLPPQGYGVSSSLLSAAANASAAAAAAAADLRPPTVTPAAVALAADPAAAAAMEGQAGVASDGMQLLSAMVGCAAVGTVLWSEFVLKDTGEPCCCCGVWCLVGNDILVQAWQWQHPDGCAQHQGGASG
jgi:hypothetical protein